MSEVSNVIEKKCNICLKCIDTIKCRDCTFNSCIECIERWAETSNKCPQCKEKKTFNIDYEEEEEEESEYEEDEEDNMPIYIELPSIETAIISDFSNLDNEIIEQILSEDRRIFPPENFIQNYNNWPQSIRNKWEYRELTLEIENEEEVVGYYAIEVVRIH
jgi:uncharacterized protein (UPF0216 family)